MRKVKTKGVRIGVVAAPIIVRRGWESDLRRLFEALAELEPAVVYGELLHARGLNLARLRAAGIDPILGRGVDEEVGKYFERLLAEYGLKGRYWYGS